MGVLQAKHMRPLVTHPRPRQSFKRLLYAFVFPHDVS